MNLNGASLKLTQGNSLFFTTEVISCVREANSVYIFQRRIRTS